jgi:hypothetical protein
MDRRRLPDARLDPSISSFQLPGFIWRADQQKSARAQHAKCFSYCLAVIRYMFQQIKHGDRIQTFISERQIGRISADKAYARSLITWSRRILAVEVNIHDLRVRIYTKVSPRPTPTSRIFSTGRFGAILWIALISHQSQSAATLEAPNCAALNQAQSSAPQKRVGTDYAFQTLPGATCTAAIAFRVSTMHCAQSASS